MLKDAIQSTATEGSDVRVYYRVGVLAHMMIISNFGNSIHKLNKYQRDGLNMYYTEPREN